MMKASIYHSVSNKWWVFVEDKILCKDGSLHYGITYRKNVDNETFRQAMQLLKKYCKNVRKSKLEECNEYTQYYTTDGCM